MPSPITWPAGVHGTNCLAMLTGKLATLLIPVSLDELERVRALKKKLTMWCDWSNSTAVSRHACCSRRQLVNSYGTTG